eukprot:TRINITY_DN2406_c1_g1_i3.p1 TRINITY_DN2406_c1_g1~~TRINITY_DN2406_c1_g1_i3.p1  ORF type:complete len:468 (+),score=141.48 TRINITY_DN2406_c1_g1_i3:154-1557(+)
MDSHTLANARSATDEGRCPTPQLSARSRSPAASQMGKQLRRLSLHCPVLQTTSTFGSAARFSGASRHGAQWLSPQRKYGRQKGSTTPPASLSPRAGFGGFRRPATPPPLLRRRSSLADYTGPSACSARAAARRSHTPQQRASAGPRPPSPLNTALRRWADPSIRRPAAPPGGQRPAGDNHTAPTIAPQPRVTVAGAPAAEQWRQQRITPAVSLSAYRRAPQAPWQRPAAAKEEAADGPAAGGGGGAEVRPAAAAPAADPSAASGESGGSGAAPAAESGSSGGCAQAPAADPQAAPSAASAASAEERTGAAPAAESGPSDAAPPCGGEAQAAADDAADCGGAPPAPDGGDGGGGDGGALILHAAVLRHSSDRAAFDSTAERLRRALGAAPAGQDMAEAEAADATRAAQALSRQLGALSTRLVQLTQSGGADIDSAAMLALAKEAQDKVLEASQQVHKLTEKLVGDVAD